MTAAQGIHGAGGSGYTRSEVAQVVAVVCRAAGPLTVEDIARSTNLGGRTVRAILGEQDGLAFLLAGGDEGYRVCDLADDAESYTHRMESQIATMAARVARRRQFAATLDRRQEALL